MGICWTRCCSLLRRNSSRIQRAGGGLKQEVGPEARLAGSLSNGSALPSASCSRWRGSNSLYQRQRSPTLDPPPPHHRPKVRPWIAAFPSEGDGNASEEARSKYFRNSSRGEHFTIEFENLVESDEGESPGSSQRPLSEEEICDLKERHYDSITRRQKSDDVRLQHELALQEEKLKLEEEALYTAQREAARAAKQKKILEQYRQQWIKQRAQATKNGDSSVPEDFESYLHSVRSQYEAVRNSRLSSDANLLTPNTESSCDLTTRTKSTSGNDDNTSLDLEWEDEEGINRLVPMRERSKTEEDILRAALKYDDRISESQRASASDDSNGLEWENDFVSAEMDDNGNSEYAGFVNPVTELSAEPQDR